MRHRHTRKAVTVVATAGLTMGAIIIGAGSAHAVASNWGCTSITFYSPSAVYGTHCQGSGSGTGWMVQEPAGTIEYRCTSFSAVEVIPPYPQAPYYDVSGSGCTAYE
jgi:hypothetical protein